MKNYLRYSHIGLTFIVIFLIIFYSGVYLDQILATEPIFIIVGMLLGFIASLWYLINEVSHITSCNSKKQHKRVAKRKRVKRKRN